MEKLTKYFTKKEFIVFCISLIVILLSTFSYAFFYSIDNRDEDIVTTECFKLSFGDENDINLDKAYPMSEMEGLRLTPYTFTIKNICNKAGEYQVNVETKEESSLSTNYLRYKLNSYSSDILGNQIEVFEYINDNINESRSVEAGVILPNEEITYNLRLWVDEGSTVSQSANKLYKGKVVVKVIENKEPYQTITLNSNGGEISHNEIIRVKQRKLGSVEDPTRVGYTFEGWYSDAELTNVVDENTIVTAALDNLYAKITPNTNTPYVVEHYQMDTSGNYPSSPTETDNLTGTTDTQVTPAPRSYEGFTSPSAEVINIDGDGNKVLKYYYTRNKYTITFNANNGSVSPTSITDYYDKQITLPTPTRTGYLVNGWYSAASNGTKYSNVGVSYTIKEAKDMYAQWSPITYTVAYNVNGGSGSVSNQSFTYGVAQNLRSASLTRTDYTFAGWSTSSTGVVTYKKAASVSNLTTTNGATVTLYAVWVKNVTNFAYNGSNGTDGSIQSYKVLADGTYQLEVWGAQGGKTTYTGNGGLGGYSKGNKVLSKNVNLYIGVGGKPAATTGTLTGGYNGGGSGLITTCTNYNPCNEHGAGGGATHIAITNNRGVLSKYSANTGEILIVAGGGGGGANYVGTASAGGTGGGTTSGYVYMVKSSGVTQSQNYGARYDGVYVNKDTGIYCTEGQPNPYPITLYKGSFGAGSQSSGGGYYGGAFYTTCNFIYSGGGGAGYIGGVTSGTSTSGQRSGHGYARITLVSLS